jgi:hypothetical protein
MNMAPEKVSYLALLLVLKDRISVQRELRDQRYFIELAQELIRLYWAHDGGQEEIDWQNAA